MIVYEIIINWQTNWHVSFSNHMTNVLQISNIMYDNTVQATVGCQKWDLDETKQI